jgi:hypothetical protein
MLEEDGIWLKRDAIASVYSTAYVARLGRQCAAYRGCTTPLPTYKSGSLTHMSASLLYWARPGPRGSIFPHVGNARGGNILANNTIMYYNITTIYITY